MIPSQRLGQLLEPRLRLQADSSRANRFPKSQRTVADDR
jgi:hypothetical protein